MARGHLGHGPGPRRGARRRRIRIIRRTAYAFASGVALTGPHLRPLHLGDNAVVVRAGGSVDIVTAALIPAEATVVPLPAEAHLLPPLADAHTHLQFDGGTAPLGPDDGFDPRRATASYRRSLATGVFHLRDLGSHRGLIDWARAGAAPGSRLSTSGPVLTSPGGHGHFIGVEISSAAEGRAGIDRLVEWGAAWIKIMFSGGFSTAGTDSTGTQFSDEVAAAMVAHAQQMGMPVAGHAHSLAAIEQAARVGVDTIEHASLLDSAGQYVIDDDLIAVVKASGSGVVATAFDGFATDTRTAEGTTSLAALAAAGVPVFVGTDSGVAGRPHHSIWLALSEMVKAGVDLEQVLRSASIDTSARIFGLEDPWLGSPTASDLLIVENDPREVLRNGGHHLAVRALIGAGDVVVGNLEGPRSVLQQRD